MNDILKQLVKLLGADSVTEAPNQANPAAFSPVARVFPDSIDALRKLVRAAPGLGITLAVSPNSAGNGAMQGHAGKPVVRIDLSRLNRILEVDVDNGYALIEPGVSFQDLHQHLHDNDLNLWIDCERNALASVSGSICQRASGYTPYGDHLLMQCGMELMLADGELVRTGMGAMPGSNTWQLFKYGYGPYIDGLFTQSNYAIVTKIGLWLMPAPPAYQPFHIRVNDEQTLAAVMESLRDLRINQIVPNTVVVSHALMDLAPFVAREKLAVSGAIDIRTVASQNDLGLWNVYGALYGLPDNVAVTWNMLEGAFAALPDASVQTATSADTHSVWYHRERAMRGIPDAALSRLEGYVGGGHLWLSAVSPIDGEDTTRAADIASAELAAAGLDPLIEFELGWRSANMRVNALFDADDSQSVQKSLEVMTQLGIKLQTAGYPIADCSPSLVHALEEPRADSGYTKLTERLRRCFDPENIFPRRPDGIAES